VGDVFTHLTNYSINKNSTSYMSNEDSTQAQGHKWTLKSLWRHFDAEGIDHSVIWEKIKDLMIKTIISAESNMSSLFQQNVSSRYSCYELFGFDILLDSRLKPWLIEVNISPSLHSSSSLDLDVKSPLATEVFNMARYHIPNRMRLKEQKEALEQMGYKDMSSLCHERRLYVKEISKLERVKHDKYNTIATLSQDTVPPTGILDELTPDDTRQLVLAEDELATSRRFTRIFPTSSSHRYFKFMEKPRYHNLLLSAWEQKYSGLERETGRTLLESLCRSKHHLKVPANVYVKKTALGQQTIDISGLAAPSSEKKDLEVSSFSQEEAHILAAESSTESGPSLPSSKTSNNEPAIPSSPVLSTLPSSSDSTVAPPVTAPLSPPPTPSPRTVPVSAVRLVVKPQGVKSVAPCSGRPSKRLTNLTNTSSSASPCPMEIESQTSEESVSPGASPLRASSGAESLSSSQELDNLKSQSLLANDNLKTSSAPDDNLIEKVDNRIAS